MIDRKKAFFLFKGKTSILFDIQSLPYLTIEIELRDSGRDEESRPHASLLLTGTLNPYGLPIDKLLCISPRFN